jgi:hypothetical protein
MTPNALPRRARVEGVDVPIVPLTVQIVRQEHDLVNYSGDLVDGERLQIPVRCRSCD